MYPQSCYSSGRRAARNAPLLARMDERGASGAKAVILERNKLVSRKLVRFMTCAGFEPIAVEDPGEVKAHLPGAYLLGADAFDICKERLIRFTD